MRRSYVRHLVCIHNSIEIIIEELYWREIIDPGAV